MNNSKNIEPEIIEIIKKDGENGLKWNPAVGQETDALLNFLNITEDSKKTLLSEAVKILSKCNPPHPANNSNTGLIVGYVQSGKTMSFTTVAALARDNGFPLIIVVAGTTVPLFDQSVSRLRRDLRLDTRPDIKWQPFVNPSITDGRVVSIRNTLMDWEDQSIPSELRQTVLITVMKNHTRLRNLNRVLQDLNLDWSKIPTLIIDDEADQASLNTKVNEGEESTTYRHITRLRETLPNNSFLQYTATPQGPLLINIINVLSPDFAEVLSPGKEYVGGKDFFIDNAQLIQRIHLNEIHAEEEPPESLRYSMAIFFVGLAAKFLKHDSGRNRSMMVHPSIRRIRHNQFFIWVTNIRDHWERTLQLPDNDQDKKDLIEDVFKIAYDDLNNTVRDFPSFDEILKNLRYLIRRTVIVEVNSRAGRTPTIDWSANSSYILVGGQAMDRGFTVEGLTVTYMPRGVGVGNADTVQQRARFFGYKRNYFGYCRIFVDQNTMQAYIDYVEHEEDIRKQLVEHGKTGKSLSEWKRVFLLPRQLHPTRRNILDIDYFQDNFSDTWFYPRAPHILERAVVGNRKLVDNYVSGLSLVPDEGHPDRTPIMRHIVNENVPLKDVYENFLTQFNLNDPADSHKFIGLQLQIRNYLERNSHDTCSIYIMSCNSWKDRWLVRERSVDSNEKIVNIFQGAHPDAKRAEQRQGEIYPADNNIGDKSRLIIQIHKLNLSHNGAVIAKDIYDIAVWIPESMSSPWLAQEQNSN